MYIFVNDVMVIIRSVLFFLLILSVGASEAQVYDPVSAENSLKQLFEKLNQTDSDVDRKKVSDEIKVVLEGSLNNPISFWYPFDSISGLGSIYSQDSTLRIFTWSYSYSPLDYKYFGFLQHRDSLKESVSVIFLDHNDAINDFNQDSVYTNDNWYGAFYYQVRVIHHNDEVFYTLIGFDFNDVFTNIKLIDVLTIENGVAYFGAPLLYFGYEVRKRVIFEYSSAVVMLLRFTDDNRIIYDHLSPSSPRFRGQYRYYGPDLSYDALRFENGRWIHHPDVEPE
jgi:hypothetical protein